MLFPSPNVRIVVDKNTNALAVQAGFSGWVNMNCERMFVPIQQHIEVISLMVLGDPCNLFSFELIKQEKHKKIFTSGRIDL